MTHELVEQIAGLEKSQVTIHETLTRGVAVEESGLPMIYPDRVSLGNEMESRRMKLYLGIDPTSPELHIGHTVPLRKLRQFQDLGHEVVLLFGTFTGMIGDPTDKGAARIRLTRDQIAHNISEYWEQAGKILDLSPDSKNPITIEHNDKWLTPINFEGVLDLASKMTVQQLLQRSMFADRMKNGTPIYAHEFLYPLMQGYDSVAMGVDLEVGGKDQVFNMLVGRDLVREMQGRNKWVMGTKLIEDPSGKKMGKTEGNIVNIRDFPEVKYEGIMTWPDTAIGVGFELITNVPYEKFLIIKEKLEDGSLDPMVTKEALAFRVVSELDGNEAALYAQEEFRRVKRMGLMPRRMDQVQVEKGARLDLILVSSGLAKNLIDAKDKITRSSIFIDGQQVGKNITWPDTANVIQVGKKTIKNIRRVITV
jgi:tyrosyl-tRNA synthetase